MSRCTPTTEIMTIYDCATFCEKWNDSPLAYFRYHKNKLIQNSVFFDSGVMNNRQFKWIFKSLDYEIYNTGWGTMNNAISGLSGSTFAVLDLGLNNIKIINYLSTLPSIQITTKDSITISLKVKDCDGYENKNDSNKYKFNKQ